MIRSHRRAHRGLWPLLAIAGVAVITLAAMATVTPTPAPPPVPAGAQRVTLNDVEFVAYRRDAPAPAILVIVPADPLRATTGPLLVHALDASGPPQLLGSLQAAGRGLAIDDRRGSALDLRFFDTAQQRWLAAQLVLDGGAP